MRQPAVRLAGRDAEQPAVVGERRRAPRRCRRTAARRRARRRAQPLERVLVVGASRRCSASSASGSSAAHRLDQAQPDDPPDRGARRRRQRRRRRTPPPSRGRYSPGCRPASRRSRRPRAVSSAIIVDRRISSGRVDGPPGRPGGSPAIRSVAPAAGFPGPRRVAGSRDGSASAFGHRAWPPRPRRSPLRSLRTALACALRARLAPASRVGGVLLVERQRVAQRLLEAELRQALGEMRSAARRSRRSAPPSG